MQKTILTGLILMLLVGAGCNLDTWSHFKPYPCGEPTKPIVETTVFINPVDDDSDGQVTGDYWARTLLFQITADYPEGLTEPDEILVDGKVPERGELWEVGPQHQILVRKTGYETIQGPLNIPPGFGDFTVIRELVSKERKIVLRITDKGSGKKIEPDEVLIGAQKIKDGDMVKPGETTLEIKKRGYRSIVEGEFSIEVGEGSYILTREMSSGKVELRFEFTDAKTKKPIDADRVTLNDEATAEGSYIEPGPYQLIVAKQGYNIIKTRIDVPQSPLYTIKRALQPAQTGLYWEIMPDYPKDMGKIDPVDVVLLDGKEIEEGRKIAPGQHNIEFRQSGFAPLIDTIKVANKKQFTYKGVLISLPRLVGIKVHYDIAPPPGHPSYRVSMRNMESNKSYRQSGVRLKPGTYKISVTQPAYRSDPLEKRIFPASYPEEVEIALDAKERVVQATINYDITPPRNLKAHMIAFVEKGKSYSRTVRPGGKIKPGIYYYEVEKPGYEMVGGRKEARIIPSEKEYKIEASMSARSRKISFRIVDEKGRLVEPEEIKIEGEVFSYDNTYRPRKKSYRIEATFKKYKKVTKNFVLPPGVGPYSVSLDLSK